MHLFLVGDARSELWSCRRMAECSEVEDAELCQVAVEAESVCDEHSLAITQACSHPPAVDVPDASKSPVGAADCDKTTATINTDGEEIGYGDNDNGVINCYANATDSDALCGLSKMTVYADVIRHKEGIPAECLPENLTVDNSSLGEHLPTSQTTKTVDISHTIPAEDVPSTEIADTKLTQDSKETPAEFDNKKPTAECSTDADGDPPTCVSSTADSDSLTAEGSAAMKKEKSPHLAFSYDVLLVAPTGKAANVLGRRTGIQALTMHQVIFSYFLWRQNCTEDSWKFGAVRALVVDECSLVAVTTFHSLMSKVLPSLQKVVLLGDTLQLPSIEPGTQSSLVLMSNCFLLPPKGYLRHCVFRTSLIPLNPLSPTVAVLDSYKASCARLG